MMDTNVSMYAYMRGYHAKSGSVAVARGINKISFPRLFKEIDRVAGGLYALGLRQGDVLMAALPNIEQSVALLYAVSKLGAVLSPVHPLISKEEFKREVELQKPKIVVLSDVNIFDFAPLCGGARRIYCPYWAHAYVGLPLPKKYPEYVGDGEIPALHMHSGGTSGTPKTVVLSAKAANALVDNLLSSIPYDFGEKDGMLVTLPMFHGFGLIVGVHVSLSSSMRAILVPKFSGKRVVRATVRNRATTMIAVPRMIKKLLDEQTFSGDNVSSLANVYVGGDALDAALKTEFDKRMKDAGSSAVIQQGYGLTEMGSVCVLSGKNGDPSSVGKAINGVKTHLVDEDESGAGELVLSSDQQFSGYLGENSGDGFMSYEGENCVKTGDIFRKDKDGNLYFVGRKKRLIKISGMNVFPLEIERVACELEFVHECAAVEFKENGKSFIGLLVAGELDERQKEEISKRISEKLSHWHTPKEIRCTDSLPRTSIGKIDYLRIQNEYRENR